MAMVSLDRDRFIKPSLIKTTVLKLPAIDRLAVGFEGLNADEVRTLIDCAIKIEQARTGDILSPTEYGNRFSGLDIE
jgi:hypothetical protein